MVSIDFINDEAKQDEGILDQPYIFCKCTQTVTDQSMDQHMVACA